MTTSSETKTIEIKSIMVADSLDWTINFLKNYQPIKYDGNWYPAHVVVHEADKIYENSEQAFQSMRQNTDNLGGNTIQVCQLPNNQFAFLYNSQ